MKKRMNPTMSNTDYTHSIDYIVLRVTSEYQSFHYMEPMEYMVTHIVELYGVLSTWSRRLSQKEW